MKPQEIRNCVFRGEFSALLKDANRDPNWRLIIGRPNLDKHQKDVELLLRVFALVGSGGGYEKPMKEYLNKAMKKHQSGSTKKVNSFLKVFPKVTEHVVSELGEKPFNLRGPINVSALDSVMAVLIENQSKLSKINLTEKYANLIKDDEFLEDTSVNTTDTKTVNSRIQRVKNVLFGG